MDQETDNKIKINKTAPVVEPKKKKRGGFISKLIFLIVLAALGYSQYELYTLKSPVYQQKAAEKQTQNLVKKISKLMVLPEGTPQVVVVQDAETIKKQQLFFKNAENGDFVLLYTDTAILYSPSKDKIVNVGPIINEGGQQVAPQPQRVQENTAGTTTRR